MFDENGGETGGTDSKFSLTTDCYQIFGRDLIALLDAQVSAVKCRRQIMVEFMAKHNKIVDILVPFNRVQDEDAILRYMISRLHRILLLDWGKMRSSRDSDQKVRIVGE